MSAAPNQGAKRPTRAKPGSTELTEREKEALVFVGKGMQNKEIAELMKVSEHTVNDWLRQILRKLNVSNRVEAAVWACKAGLL